MGGWGDQTDLEVKAKTKNFRKKTGGNFFDIGKTKDFLGD